MRWLLSANSGWESFRPTDDFKIAVPLGNSPTQNLRSAHQKRCSSRDGALAWRRAIAGGRAENRRRDRDLEIHFAIKLAEARRLRCGKAKAVSVAITAL